jgi:hypothetical protein
VAGVKAKDIIKQEKLRGSLMAVKFETKATKWARIEKQFKKISDRLGTLIDQKILSLVVALNALGLETLQSCEGHIEYGTYAPWVSFNVPSAAGYKAKVLEIADRHADEDRPRYSAEECGELYRLADMQKKSIAQARIAVDRYIDLFYAEHKPMKPESKIVVRDGADFFLIEAQGSAKQQERRKDARKRHLALYQQEFQAFADFLKYCYDES